MQLSSTNYLTTTHFFNSNFPTYPHIHTHTQTPKHHTCTHTRTHDMRKGCFEWNFPPPIWMRASNAIEYASDINTWPHTHIHMSTRRTHRHEREAHALRRGGTGLGHSVAVWRGFDFGASTWNGQPIAWVQAADWTNFLLLLRVAKVDTISEAIKFIKQKNCVCV